MTETVFEVEVDHGVYIHKLYDVLRRKSISHNRFMRETQTEYGTMKRYATGTIQRFDALVIDRWCHYLDCSFEDIIEYRRK
ncbi:MAG: helix-turn-helix transcriptional regulator [Ruminococcaceae bacterium]|nr:helix-turn-helix transcriptional regulator [Oscillospiraceae bacterium]